VAVKIRLMRVGKKKQPTYRVVVADERSPRDGRIIETIGHYGPRAEPSVVDIDGERALDWLRKGAQPSEAVQKLLTTSGVWATFEAEKSGPIVTKLNRRGYATGKAVPAKKKKKAGAEPQASAAEQAPAGGVSPPAASDAVGEDDAAPADEPAPAEAESEAAETEQAPAGSEGASAVGASPAAADEPEEGVSPPAATDAVEPEAKA
jgi:small subunit ribosomal protein S16